MAGTIHQWTQLAPVFSILKSYYWFNFFKKYRFIQIEFVGIQFVHNILLSFNVHEILSDMPSFISNMNNYLFLKLTWLDNYQFYWSFSFIDFLYWFLFFNFTDFWSNFYYFSFFVLFCCSIPDTWCHYFQVQTQWFTFC